jgi:hypothetical protein
VAFYPDVAFTVVVPVAIDPVSMGVRWFDVGSGNPDVAIAVPAMIATVPRPVGMLVGWRGDDFVRALGWTDADDYLGLGDACSEKESAG